MRSGGGGEPTDDGNVLAFLIFKYFIQHHALEEIIGATRYIFYQLININRYPEIILILRQRGGGQAPSQTSKYTQKILPA